MEKTVANPKEVRNTNFDLFYKYESEKSYLVSLMRKYQSVDISYICNI